MGKKNKKKLNLNAKVNFVRLWLWKYVCLWLTVLSFNWKISVEVEYLK